MQVTPAELFKTRYNQNVNLVMLDVRPESDYNLYHINGALNVPLDRLESITPDLLSEPPANSVFILMSNDEAAATQGWKQLVAAGVPNVYILEGGINNWIANFGKQEGFQSAESTGEDQLGYILPAALGSQYASCVPNPIEYESLEYDAKIKLERRLAPNHLADLIVLEKDPFACDPDELLTMQSSATMVGGEWVYRSR